MKGNTARPKLIGPATPQSTWGTDHNGHFAGSKSALILENTLLVPHEAFTFIPRLKTTRLWNWVKDLSTKWKTGDDKVGKARLIRDVVFLFFKAIHNLSKMENWNG